VQIEGQGDEEMVRSQGEAGDRLSQPSSPAQLIKHGKEEKHALIAGEDLENVYMYYNSALGKYCDGNE
jgi:hypothetical protein